MLIDLYKCRVSTSKNYGCIYGRIFRRKGLNLKGFAKHISEHGSLVKYDLAVLVLQNIVDCLREMMVQGVPVKLDGLGTFSPGVTSLPADTIEEYDPQTMITGVKINFQPIPERSSPTRSLSLFREGEVRGGAAGSSRYP
jgi:hypothetical protein